MANPHFEQLSERRFRTVVVLALVVLGFFAYSNTFTGEFV